MTTDKDRLVIYIQPEIKQLLQKLAAKDRRSLSIFVELILLRYLEEQGIDLESLEEPE